MPKNSEQVVIALIAGTLVLLLLGAFIFLFVLYYQKRHNRYLKEMDQLKNLYEQELLKAQLEIQEQTLTHVSEEIHDNIGQTLSVVKVQLGSLPSLSPPLNQKIEDSVGLLTKAIQDLRDVSRHLNTDFINEKGLLECLKDQVDAINKTGIYKTTLSISDDLPALSNNKELIILRMIQEVINNVLKHAKGNNLNIKISNKENRIMISISDNGIGFDKDKLAREGLKSLGLSNLKKRAAVLNGKIDLHTETNQGTCVDIEIPSDELINHQTQAAIKNEAH